MAGTASSGRRTARWVPYAMIAPTLIFLMIFFVIPIFTLFKTSLSTNTGSVYLPVQKFGWEWGNYSSAFTQYRAEIGRSFGYATVATVIMIVLAYPLAYVLAFKAGRWKNLMLGLVILPFFITFLVRTIAWKTILADDGFIVEALGTVGLLPPEGRILSTSWAVVGGLVYNFLPFMVLPIYASLAGFDFRLAEAAYDLGARKSTVIRRIILPLATPGIISGILLVFMPAFGSYVQPVLLGGGKVLLIGNLIASQFGDSRNWPFGAALSVITLVLLMVALIAIALYSRKSGKKVEISL